MASDRSKNRLFLLAALVVVLATVLITIWPRGTADTTGSGTDLRRDPGNPGVAADPSVPPALGLDRINAQRVEPANRRDLFRFGSAQPAPAAGQPDGGPGSPAGSRTPAAPAGDD